VKERAPRTASRSFLIAAGLWFLAFSHRAFLLLGNRDRSWPFTIFYEGDTETFFRHSLAILAGQVYDGGIPFHPPLFPHLLAFLHGLLGAPGPHIAVRLVLAALTSLQIPLLWVLLRRTVGEPAALAGALLCVYSFGLQVFSIAAVSEGVYLTLLLASMLLFTGLAWPQSQDSRQGPAAWIRAGAFGLSLGAASLTRAEGIGVAVLLLGWGLVLSLRHGRRARFRRDRPAGRGGPAAGPVAASFWAASACVMALVLLPWTIRNAVTIREINESTPRDVRPLPVFVVTTAYGPLNFGLANHPGAPGYFTRNALTSGLTTPVLDLRDPGHRDLFLNGYSRGLEFILREPGAFLSLAGRKLALMARFLRLGWSEWNLPGGLRGTRYPVDIFSPDSAWAVPVHLVLLLSGIWLILGRSGLRGRIFLIQAALPGLLILGTTVAFFGYVRQGALLLPWIHGIQGAALAWAAQKTGAFLPASWRKTPALFGPRSAGPPAAVLALVTAIWVAGLAGAFQDRNYRATGETMPGSHLLNRDSIMHLEWIRNDAD